MDEIEIEALLIRHQAAMDSWPDIDMRGLRLLAWVVSPTDEFREASMQAARERGPGALAKKLAAADRSGAAASAAAPQDRKQTTTTEPVSGHETAYPEPWGVPRPPHPSAYTRADLWREKHTRHKEQPVRHG